MWCTIIATDGNCSIFFNNDSRVLLEKQHTQEPKYKRNSRKTKANQNEVINKDENSRPQKCTSSLLLVVMTRKCQWFSWTCWSLAVLTLRLSTIFFSFSKISESQTDPLCEEEENSISIRLAWIIFSNLFYYSAYFCYYSWVTLHFLVLFISPTILFQLTFTFIYSTFSKKILVSAK